MPVVDPDDSDNEDVEDIDNYTTSLDNYLNYFENTWIGGMNKRTQVRGKPKYKMNLWNKYNAIKDGQVDLTSNRSEAWNSASKISISMKPNLWILCKNIKKEEGLAKAKFQSALCGDPPSDPNPKRTSKRIKKFNDLKVIIDQYGRIPIGTYIDALVALFNAD